jgi:putative ABC transport system permease protein
VGSLIIEELFEGLGGPGEGVRIGSVPFTIIGVLEKKGLGAAGRSQDDVVFIPLSTAKSRVLGAVRGTSRDALDFISVKVSEPAACRRRNPGLKPCFARGTGFMEMRRATSGSKIRRMS